MMTLVHQHSSDPAALKILFSSLTLVSKIFYSLNYQDLPEYFEDNMQTWMDSFYTLLMFNSKLLQTDVNSWFVLSVNVFVYVVVSVFVKFICLFVCLYGCLSICLFVCLSICLSICLFICLFICPSICLFILSVLLSVYLSAFCLFICLFISSFVLSVSHHFYSSNKILSKDDDEAGPIELIRSQICDNIAMYAQKYDEEFGVRKHNLISSLTRIQSTFPFSLTYHVL